jgi:hypothetical protein
MKINYINSLEDQLHVEKNVNDSLHLELNNVIGYLCSPKFHEDTTVQVGDIIRRIMEAKAIAEDVRADTRNRLYFKRLHKAV